MPFNLSHGVAKRDIKVLASREYVERLEGVAKIHGIRVSLGIWIL